MLIILLKQIASDPQNSFAAGSQFLGKHYLGYRNTLLSSLTSGDLDEEIVENPEEIVEDQEGLSIISEEKVEPVNLPKITMPKPSIPRAPAPPPPTGVRQVVEETPLVEKTSASKPYDVFNHYSSWS